jgi:AraC-like DNA-binding protein
MTSHVFTYIIFVSGSLVVFKLSDNAIKHQYLRLSFFICCVWMLNLFFCSHCITPVANNASLTLTDGSVLLFLLVPASNVYLRNRLYERRPKLLDWNHLRQTLVKFILNIKGYLQMKASFYFTTKKAETRAHRSTFLTKERVSQIDVIVGKHFEERKPYLQLGYSLQMLSDETQISVHHLSAFINERYKINFNTFINEHRVIICVEKLLQSEWRFKKLEAIAQECGFNNRNTFTSAFKKTTGLNPSEFLKNIKRNKLQQTTEFDYMPVNRKIAG